jgi:heme-degrading monooxygenase HmoA
MASALAVLEALPNSPTSPAVVAVEYCLYIRAEYEDVFDRLRQFHQAAFDPIMPGFLCSFSMKPKEMERHACVLASWWLDEHCYWRWTHTERASGAHTRIAAVIYAAGHDTVCWQRPATRISTVADYARCPQ